MAPYIQRFISKYPSKKFYLGDEAWKVENVEYYFRHFYDGKKFFSKTFQKGNEPKGFDEFHDLYKTVFNIKEKDHFPKRLTWE